MLLGLNRTSVGLKRISTTLGMAQDMKPQSNQRGIETCSGLLTANRGVPGLNRTSVGLKPVVRFSHDSCHALPQSNQRGIETTFSDPIRHPRLAASIEPAWD